VPKFGDRAKAMTFELTNPESMIKEYIAFLAWDSFVATHTTSSSTTGGEGLRMPGQVTEDDSTDIEGDTEKLTGIAHTILDSLIKEAGEHIDDPEYSDIKDSIAKVCTELARAGGGELHNIASLTGGMVAQEVIKVITRQYIPVDNTCLFDGVGSRAGVLRI
jgi:amyloid beta precursor protein binding protein 1